jgi:flagellar biosynthesis protein FlhF
MSAVISEAVRQGFDRVIVDLPVLSKDAHLEDMLGEFGLSGLEPVQTALHLVLSPQYGDAFVRSLLERYRLDIPGSIIWTKLDEAGRYGTIINASQVSGLPISCLSFGPGLLNTLVPARPAALWKLLFKHELPVISTAFAGVGDNYE